MKLKVLLTSNIPAPYFVNYADELGKYVDLTVVFELPSASDRDETWKNSLSDKNFKYIILNARRFGVESGLSFKIKKILKNNTFDRIIIANPTTPTGVISLLYCRKHNIHFIIQSEGGFQGTGKGLKEKFKKYIMERADFFLTGMGGDNDYFLKYGATKETLRQYYFTSSYSIDIDSETLPDEKKEIIKKELGFNYKSMILYVGQFIYRKGIDVLLKAYQGLDNETCLVLVGGSPTKEYFDLINKLGLKNVYFRKFSSKEALRKYYQAADLFVMMTREDTWGLVINEAMEHGLPVITTNKCIAGIQLIKDGINGYIIDSENIKESHDKMEFLLKNDSLRNKIGRNNLNKIKEHNIENMAKKIYEYIKYQ